MGGIFTTPFGHPFKSLKTLATITWNCKTKILTTTPVRYGYSRNAPPPTWPFAYSRCKQADHGLLDVDITDRYGNRPVRIRFDADGQIKAGQRGAYQSIQGYEPDRWYQFEINVVAKPYGHFDLSIDHHQVLKHAPLSVAVKSVERISFRTGPYRNHPTRKTNNEQTHPPMAGADNSVKNASYHVDDVILEAK